ncbi:MAG TPA: hypothetical protein PK280_11395 [Planctomycetota bacterium]|nr:hypothetical protein [Planctomycetota bacterium]
MRTMPLALVLLAVAGCSEAVLPTPAPTAAVLPAFTAGPTTLREAGGVRVSFAVNAETDVAVAVEDARGRVVRHLAAGRLGQNAPAPLAAGKLEQDLLWDGRDDRGRPAGDGPFRVRVGLGLTPTFAELIGFRPEALGGVRGLATGPDGSLYVFHTSGMEHTHDDGGACAVFSREGKYLRTILPYPASLPDDRLKGLRRIDLGGGVRVPFIYQFETRSLLPGLGDLPRQRPVVTRDGLLAFVGVQEGPQPFAQAGLARLTVINTDGGVPAGGVLGTRIHPLTDTGASLALSPDEKILYATGVRACVHGPVAPGAANKCDECVHGGETWRHTKPDGLVYRFGWTDAKAGRFGAGVTFKEPTGVATDQDGNVYVSDPADDRIAVLAPDGRLLRSLAVAKPQRVEVHRKTGAIYVLSGDTTVDLLKLDSAGKEIARAPMPALSSKYGFLPIRRPVMALDDSAEPAIIWTNGPLIRVEDRGGSFGDPVRVLPSAPKDEPGSIGAVLDLSLDDARGRLYVNSYWRYELDSGRWSRVTVPGKQQWPGWTPANGVGRVGLDGNYYFYPGAGAYLHRLDPEFASLPFPGSPDKEGRLHGWAKDFGYGHAADASGNVYVLWKKLPLAPGDLERTHILSKHGPDGQLLKEKLVDADIPYLRSVRVDFAGNTYMLCGLRPGKETVPPGLRGQVLGGPRDRDAVNGVNPYPLIYGSVVKFGPEGGVIRKGSGGVRCNYSYRGVTEVRGAQWIFPGASVMCSWGAGEDGVAACRCEVPGFDVDGFGRSFFCDAGRFRIGVLDTAGNEICWFGGYGNQDSAGPGSAAPRPEIAFAWPQAVAVGDRDALVGDRVNRRITRVKLAYRAEAARAVE